MCKSSKVTVAILTALFTVAFLHSTDFAFAHHTYVTKYDPDKVVTLKGTISSVNYRNPHIFFDIAVSNPDGSTTTWTVETESIAKVQAKGLTEANLRIGGQVVATGWMAREKTAEIGLKSLRIGSKTYSIRNTPR